MTCCSKVNIINLSCDSRGDEFDLMEVGENLQASLQEK